MKIELTQNQKKLIQKVVKLEETAGSKTSASAIAGLIIVTGNVGLCFEDIQDTLGLSKGAVSLGVNLLIGIGKLESFKKFGERKRYFRLPRNISIREHIGAAVALCHSYKELVNELFNCDEIEFDAETKRVMEEDLEFMKFVIGEIENSIKKWKEMNGYEVQN